MNYKTKYKTDTNPHTLANCTLGHGNVFQHMSLRLPTVLRESDQNKGRVPENEFEDTLTETEKTTFECGIDWWRWSGPVELMHQTLNCIREVMGREMGEPKIHDSGLWFYKNRLEYPCGINVCWTEYRDGQEHVGHFAFEMTGKAIEQFGQAKALELNCLVHHLGCSATRADLKLDWFALPDGWLEQVIESCRNGELCIMRKWKHHEGYKASGEPDNMGIEFGSRLSEKYMRWYHKGLEQQTKEDWLRLELECKGDIASQVSEQLAKTSLDDVGTSIVGTILGSIDFRQGSRNESRSRRTRSQWWADFTCGIETQSLSTRRSKTELDGYTHWLKKCVAPSIETLAKAGNMNRAQVWQTLVGDVPAWQDIAGRAVVWQFVQMLEHKEQAAEALDFVNDVITELEQ